jgi:hypothetical protein
MNQKEIYYPIKKWYGKSTNNKEIIVLIQLNNNNYIWIEEYNLKDKYGAPTYSLNELNTIATQLVDNDFGGDRNLLNKVIAGNLKPDWVKAIFENNSPAKIEEECDHCKRMKDIGDACWCCGLR